MKTKNVALVIVAAIIIGASLFIPNTSTDHDRLKQLVQQREYHTRALESLNEQIHDYCDSLGLICENTTVKTDVIEEKTTKIDYNPKKATKIDYNPKKATITKENKVVTSIWRNQELNPLPEIHGNTPSKRFNNFLAYFGHNPAWYVEARNKYGVKEEVLACIVWADTGFMNLKSKWNYGNVGNNDRGDTVNFSWPQQWINAIAQTITNKYLWRYTTMWELSQWGRTEMKLKWCAEKGEFCYATSEKNWNMNTLDCLTMIHGKRVNEDFKHKKS